MIGTALIVCGCGLLTVSTVGAFIFKPKPKDESLEVKLNKLFISTNICSNNGFANGDKIYAKVIKELEPNKAYLISVPYGRSIKDFKVDAIKMIIGDSYDIDIRWFNSGVILLELIKEMSEKFPRLIKYETNEESEKFPCPITIDLGVDINGDIIKLNLSDNPHSYICGTTNSGKSNQLKIILLELITKYSADVLELILCDLKMCELSLFKDIIHCSKFVYSVEDTTEVIADLLEECKRRFKLFMNHKCINIFEYNKRVGGEYTLKYKVVVVEELTILLIDKKKTAMNLLKQLISISRACGIYIILTTQRPSADIIDSVVKANINNRIVFKCEDSKNSIIALDNEEAINLNGNGEGILKVGANYILFKSYYISTTELKQLLKPYIKPKEDPSTKLWAPLPSNKSSNDAIVRSDSNSKIVIDNTDDIDLSFLDSL